ncbi:MAG: selenocysteine-specific translation elongation factor [Bacteroidales bacterium]|nr:selenocysteine-specific translation elongation factor [Bacteroidales bacterium]
MIKRHLIVGTAGHVDHGKTSLVKALTNVDCDTHKEEKERGITISLGFSHLKFPSGDSIGIVDVPGHKNFIKTMVAGAHGIDMVLLVIAADSGVMPQTREHLNIIKMLHVKEAIVVLTKSDLVDEDMLELAKFEITELLEDTPLEDAPIVAVSTLMNHGIGELKSLIETKISEISVSKPKGDFRMYIDRLFNVKGIGIVVTGSVLNGELSVGQELLLLPGSKKKVKVKGIQRHREVIEKVVAGDRAALHISGIKIEDYKKGMILSTAEIENSQMVDASIRIFNEHTKIKVWSQVIFLSGTYESPAKIHMINKDNLRAGEEAIAQIHLEKAYPFLLKDKFIIRNSSNDQTIGGGVIIDSQPLHHKRRTTKLIRQLEELTQACIHGTSLLDLIRMEITKSRLPESLTGISQKLKISSDAVESELQQYETTDIRVYELEDTKLLIIEGADKHCSEIVLEALREYHEKNPMLISGLDTHSFAGKPGFSNYVGKIYLQALLNRLFDEKKIKLIDNTWALFDHVVKINAKTKEQIEWYDQKMLQQGMQNPLMKQIEQAARDRKIPKEKQRILLQYLIATNRLMLSEGEYVHIEIVNKARKILVNGIIEKGTLGLNEKEFRERIDGSKKFVQSLLKIFLDEGIVSKRAYYIDLTDKGRALIVK